MTAVSFIMQFLKTKENMKNFSSHVSDVLRLYSAMILFVLEGHGQTKVIAYWPVCESQLTAPLGAELTDRSDRLALWVMEILYVSFLITQATYRK